MRTAVIALVLSACTQDFNAFQTTTDPVSLDAGDYVDAQIPQVDSASATDVSIAAADTSTPPQDSAVADVADASVPCNESKSVMFGNHCYFFVTGNVNWSTAANDCKAAGAHLATLSTAQEKAAVVPMGAGLEWWLGMSKASSDPSVDAKFMYITGEARTSYSNWATNEPSNAGSCVRLTNGGEWGALSCVTNRYYLCERE